uniref:Xaa-Pro aminopeptidase n=1 Tax=Araucaria cunninghamii TaxID=56994 RepID=A0A0D6R2D6_ARACU
MGSEGKRQDPLDALRPLMEAHSPPLHALIVPSEDAHQSEYVAAWDKRRAYVSGFTGSAGLVLVLRDEALLWTDGRYFLQATQQLSKRWKLMRIGEDPAVETWIADNLDKDATIGVDPWCMSVDTAHRWQQAFLKKEQKLVQLEKNLIDEIWKERPLPEALPICIQPLEFAGCSVKQKLDNLRANLDQEKAEALIVTALDEVAWLYNIRGSDVAYNPVVHAFAIVTRCFAFLYVDKRKVTSEVEKHLIDNGIEIRNYDAVLSDSELLSCGQLLGTKKNGVLEKEGDLSQKETVKEKHNLIWIDPGSCCFALFSRLPSDRVLQQQSPLALSKALKNPVELNGLRNAHIRDGAAVVNFLSWLDIQMQEIYGAAGYFSEVKGSNKRKHSEITKLTEVSVSDKLEAFRSEQEYFKGLSFPTISSVGPNAAIIHYEPKHETCAELQPESVYLCDSGAQYLDGTTDITRTVHFGKPSAHEKSCYTAVLKGHIALDTAVFPNGTTGNALDILARATLWKNGLDYRHGTGHGIGSYLNVHEGPHLISFKPQARNVALQASMTVTDEPGYYEDGNFGIRLENVLVIKQADTKFNFGDKGYLAFEHITWVPYQTKLIDVSMLSPCDVNWVNDYHMACREKLKPYLKGVDLEWLEKATETISC